jgi:predicted nucleotidyltransferase
VAPSDGQLPADRLKQMEPFARLGAALNQAGVRFVVIGVAGANLWARSGQTIFATRDYDLFLPPDPENALLAWQAAEALGLRLFCGDEPLDRPRDLFLAQQIIERRALVRASDGEGFDVDLALVMAGFEFEDVFGRRRMFDVTGVPIGVALLRDIVASKAAAGREKDRLFLAAHAEALKSIIEGAD